MADWKRRLPMAPFEHAQKTQKPVYAVMAEQLISRMRVSMYKTRKWEDYVTARAATMHTTLEYIIFCVITFIIHEGLS